MHSGEWRVAMGLASQPGTSTFTALVNAPVRSVHTLTHVCTHALIHIRTANCKPMVCRAMQWRYTHVAHMVAALHTYTTQHCPTPPDTTQHPTLHFPAMHTTPP